MIPRASPYLLLTLTALLWSGNFVVARGIQGTLPPLAMAFWRWVIALAIIAPFAAAPLWRERALVLRRWKVLALLGILGVGSFNTLVYVGLGSTTATNALLLNSAIPVLIVALAWLFLRQAASGRQITGILVSLLGVAAIVFQASIAGALALRVNPGDLWVFAAVTLWAVYTLALRGRPDEISPVVFLACTFVAGLAAILPFYLGERAAGARMLLNAPGLAAMAYLGVFPSVLAYLFWNAGVAAVGARRAGLFIHLMPVFGTLLAIAFLGESLRTYHVAGIALIVAGIWLATRDPGGRAAWAPAPRA
ncbi:MAG: DMT family transporter, partial [Burkholderiales bacterium]|nr:DMT family transporter [Burkholderiales bacterium]